MDTLFALGGFVKVKRDGSVGFIEGIGVPFSPVGQGYDCVGDRFDNESYLALDDGRRRIDLLFEHGADPVVGLRVLSKATFRIDRNRGVFVKAKLDLTDNLNQKVYEASLSGNMGFSSATSPHRVERIAEKKVGDQIFYWLKTWPIIELSITPRACSTETPAQATIPSKTAFDPLPLDQLIAMSPDERLQWEKQKTAAAMQRAIDAGEELSLEIRRRFSLVDPSWLNTQSRLHRANQTTGCKCGVDKGEIEELKRRLARYESADRYASQRLARVARTASMRIPQR
jgi:hypothetical protein